MNFCSFLKFPTVLENFPYVKTNLPHHAVITTLSYHNSPLYHSVSFQLLLSLWLSLSFTLTLTHTACQYNSKDLLMLKLTLDFCVLLDSMIIQQVHTQIAHKGKYQVCDFKIILVRTQNAGTS